MSKYEKPKLVSLNDGDATRGQYLPCNNTGSSAFDCYPGSGASDTCGANGQSASDVCYIGGNATVHCDSGGNR